MADFNNKMIIKIVISIIIFAILMSIKSVTFANIENFGLTPFQENELLQTWGNFQGDYLFILISIAISLLIGLKFSMKI